MISKLILEANAGPFAPLVGYIGAIVGAIFLIRQMIWGSKQLWVTPGDILPRLSIRIIGIISGISMVAIWLYASPETLSNIITISIVAGIGLIVSFVTYYFLENNLTYNNAKTNQKIIGGFMLTQDARDKRKRVTSIQILFDGASMPEDVWTRNSIAAAKLLILYLIAMLCGTSAMTAAGFGVQVKLTKKSATDVIKKEDAPGLDSVKNNKYNVKE